MLISIGIIGAAVLLFTLDLGHVSLRDWDEGLVAQVAREISQAPIQDQVWLHPTLNGEPYFNKPPFIHWLVAILYTLGGIHEWTARLPGALATALSVFLLYRVGREIFPQRMTALLSACTYLTLLPLVRHGRLAMLDGMVLCAFLGLLVCVLRSRYCLRWALGAGISLGVLMLTKGIIAVPLMTIAVIFIAVDAPRLLRSPRWWLGIVLGCIPGLLWYLAQGWHYGQAFWDAHLLRQSLDRVSQSVEQHSGPPWYYGLELFKYSWPWLLFLPMGIRIIWQNRALSWAKLLGVWGIGYLGLISMMGTKLPWYIMPFYPVFALTVGIELHRLWSTISGESPILRPTLWYRWGLGIFLGIFALAGWGGFIYFSGFSPLQAIADFSVAAPLAAMGLTMTVALILLCRSDRQFISILLWGFYCCLLLFMMSHHWNWELEEDYEVKPVAEMIRSSLPTALPSHFQPEPTAIASAIPERTPSIIFTSHPYKRPSLDFYSGHNVKPMGLKKIQQQWRKKDSMLLLLDTQTLQQLKLKRVVVLGEYDYWKLISKQKNKRNPQPSE